MTIKRLIRQEDITNLNVLHLIRASKYMNQKLILLQGEIEKPIILHKYSITSFSITHRICRLKISKGREDFNNTINRLELTFKYHSTDQEQNTEFFSTVNEG